MKITLSKVLPRPPPTAENSFAAQFVTHFGALIAETPSDAGRFDQSRATRSTVNRTSHELQAELWSYGRENQPTGQPDRDARHRSQCNFVEAQR